MSLPDSTATIYRIHISLRDIEPLIWRRVELSNRTSLKQLHEILQLVMGWQNCHMHQFQKGKQRYGIVDRSDPFDADTLPEAQYTLADVLPGKGSKLLYWYDFGDDWFHEIKLESTLAPDPTANYPRLVDGARSCPPEDCGGPFGYENLLLILKNKKHPEHRGMSAWLGSDFDPEDFPIRHTALALRRKKSLAPKA
jgi:hypothetical protein